MMGRIELNEEEARKAMAKGLPYKVVPDGHDVVDVYSIARHGERVVVVLYTKSEGGPQ